MRRQDSNLVLSLPAPTEQLASKLLEWYGQKRRFLPWREDPTPYRVWVSEIMLQQTQVRTVLPYFERFIARFPDISTLANAQEDQVLAAWSGLGYYSRARNLLKAARRIVEDHGGVFPRDQSAVLELPGVGPYTAGAIRSIAFDEPDAIIDGNVRRVMARLLSLEGPIDGFRTKQLWALLSEVVRSEHVAPRVSHFNQALMELGALVCTPGRPDCVSCPWSTECVAFQRGLQSEIPPARKRRRTESFDFVPLVVFERGHFLLRQNEEEPFLRGFWEFPKVPGLPGPDLVNRFQTRWSVEIAGLRPLPSVRHQITFRRMSFYPVLGRITEIPASWRWIQLDHSEVPVSSYIKKIRDVVSGC